MFILILINFIYLYLYFDLILIILFIRKSDVYRKGQTSLSTSL